MDLTLQTSKEWIIKAEATHVRNVASVYDPALVSIVVGEEKGEKTIFRALLDRYCYFPCCDVPFLVISRRDRTQRDFFRRAF